MKKNINLIVGLGNPGIKYAKTRHNIGFMAVDALAKDLKLTWRFQKNLHAEIIKFDDIILLKPQTFMNNSGLAVVTAIKKFGIQPADALVIFDDLDMEVGKIRVRSEGSSGGHRGLQSIIDNLKTDQITRLKIGIGRSDNIEPDKYVLGKFTADELQQIKTAIPAAVEIINKQFLSS